MRIASRRLAGFMSLLLALCFASPAADAYDQWDAIITTGISAFAKKDFDRSAEIYSKALGLRSAPKSDAKVLGFRAAAFWYAGKPEQAESDYTMVIKLVGETDPIAYHERGHFYHRTNRFDAALADYTTGARFFPDNGKFPNGQGLALSAKGNHDEAIKRFDDAIRLDPTSAVFVLGRAEAYNRSSRAQPALEDYDRALALGKLTLNDTGRLRSGRGYAYLVLKDYTAAIAEFDLALELQPGFVNALKWRGLSFEYLGDIGRALRDYEAVLKLKPSDTVVAQRIDELRARKK